MHWCRITRPSACSRNSRPPERLLLGWAFTFPSFRAERDLFRSERFLRGEISLGFALAATLMDIRIALKQGIAQLRDAQVPSYTLAAELLLLHVLGRDRTWIYSHSEEEIVAPVAERYSELVRRRAAGEPTQHLTGRQEFWGLEFEVTPDVLIPRPETEHVI